MNYSIQEAANKFGVSVHTLRYYDKEGLLPFIQRDKVGNRIFKDADFNWLAMVVCLKQTGMPLKEIKKYADYCKQGIDTVKARQNMLTEHRSEVVRQMEELQGHLARIDGKIAVYADPELARKQYVGFE